MYNKYTSYTIITDFINNKFKISHFFIFYMNYNLCCK